VPIGCCSLVPMIATEFGIRKPASVLDLGIGMGFYGAVVRQWCDMGVRPWRTRLVGVEAWEGYCNPCWDLYDEVVIEPVLSFFEWSSDVWHSILLLDVVEHFEKDEGFAVLAAARKRLAETGLLYVGTPAVWMDQGDAHGNEFERHRSLWTVADFTRLGFSILHDGHLDPHGNQMILAGFAM